MFGIGPMEMVVIGIVGVLLFGKRLPDVGRSVGKSIMEFKKGISGIEEDLDTASRRPSSRSYDEADHDDTDERLEAAAPKFEPPVSEPQPEVAKA